MALIVEGYREFMEWWQTRSFLRPLRATGDADSADGLEEHETDRTALVADMVGSILDRHARKHAGVAVGVLWEGARWTFARGRLCATDAAPLDANSIFEIGSVTKVFTATLLADMVEQGLVRLDDPVQRHLPEDVRLPIRGWPITLCDLATQTSGLPRLPPGLFRRSLRRRHDPYAGFSEQDLLDALARTRPKGTPGVRLRYSNFGVGLLGYVLARRARTSYGQLVRDRICTPLGLADTGIEVAENASGRSADGHNRRGRRVPPWHLDALAGAGGAALHRRRPTSLPRSAPHGADDPTGAGGARDAHAASKARQTRAGPRLGQPPAPRRPAPHALAQRRHRRLSQLPRLHPRDERRRRRPLEQRTIG
jgi:CubicO group peptidase (beta-lactamase class C family)